MVGHVRNERVVALFAGQRKLLISLVILAKNVPRPDSEAAQDFPDLVRRQGFFGVLAVAIRDPVIFK